MTVSLSPAHRVIARTCAAALLCLVSLVPLGCKKFDLNRSIPWATRHKDGPGQPSKMMAVWTDAVLTTSTAPPTRGFGGRLMFFNEETGQPIKVEGELTVYAFDEASRDPWNPRPARKFVFKAEQFEKHHSESKMGPSYSVWLPWEAAGGEQKEIALIARFVTNDGTVVMGEQTRHILPGRLSPEALAERNGQPPGSSAGGAGRRWDPSIDGQAVQPASHLQSLASDEGPYPGAPRKMTTTTIELPNRLGTTVPSVDVRSWPIDRSPVRSYTGRTTGLQAEAPQAAPSEARSRHQEDRSRGRFEPHRSRALGGPISALDRDPVRWRQSPPGSPAAPPSGSQAGQGTAY